MMATTSKSKDGKGKDKNKSKSDVLCTNLPNCGHRGHTKDQCFKEGGGKADQALEWWKKKKDKGKKSSVNVAEDKTADKNEPEDYAMLTTTDPDTPDDTTALAASNHSGIIIDSGASRHFSPDRSKFLNYKEFSNHEPIRAADGRTFHALGKGDIQIILPNGSNKST